MFKVLFSADDAVSICALLNIAIQVLLFKRYQNEMIELVIREYFGNPLPAELY